MRSPFIYDNDVSSAWGYCTNRLCLRRSEADLSINIKKATNPDETAPKRKHVRSCIVYTWDHKSGHAFWAALKVCV